MTNDQRKLAQEGKCIWCCAKFNGKYPYVEPVCRACKQSPRAHGTSSAPFRLSARKTP